MISSFGTNGVVDLKQGVVYGNRQPIDLETGEIGMHSTPAIAKDVIIVGSSFREGATVRDAQQHQGSRARVRRANRQAAVDLQHHSAARASSATKPGRTTRGRSTATPACGRRFRSTKISGLAYLPVETPSSDYYGGHRPGNNLFAESLVAVDLRTGQRKWHYQYVHHPIWNFDNSSSPILMDINVNGRTIKAVASPSKQGYLYVLDRATGQPVWPIEERPVPQSDMPGEKTSPTQPFPTKPPAYGRNFLTVPDDVIDFTPELRAQALDVLKRYKVGNVAVHAADARQRHRHARCGRRRDGDQLAGLRQAIPSMHVVYAQAGNAPTSRSLVAPPQGLLGHPLRVGARAAGRSARCSVPATAAPPMDRQAVRADQLQATEAAPRRHRGRGRRCQRRTHRAGTADLQAAIRRALGDQSRSRRDHVAGAGGRHAGQRAQSSGAARHEHPEDRAARRIGRRLDGDQDASS